MFTYGYDASVLGTGSTSTIRNIANHLAESLDTRASDSTGVNRYPIAYVGSTDSDIGSASYNINWAQLGRVDHQKGR